MVAQVLAAPGDVRSVGQAPADAAAGAPSSSAARRVRASKARTRPEGASAYRLSQDGGADDDEIAGHGRGAVSL